jgi:hypothetical protein
MADKRKPFGKKGVSRPPPILLAPAGLDGGPPVRSPARKASLTVALFAIGAAAMAGGVAWLSNRDDPACRADAQTPGGRPASCDQRSSSGSHGGSSSSHWYGFSSGSSSTSSGHVTTTASPSGGHGSFGGFGATGAGHSGGHGSGA